jgi:hypothetical protein
MKEKNTSETSSSRVTWESLENWVRLKIQGWVGGPAGFRGHGATWPREIGATKACGW